MGTIICRVEEGYVYGVFFLRVLKKKKKKSLLKRLNKQAVLIDKKEPVLAFRFCSHVPELWYDSLLLTHFPVTYSC